MLDLPVRDSCHKLPRYYTYSYRYIFVSTYCYMQYYIFKKGNEKRLVVEDKEQRKRIIGAIHDPSHMGVNRTLDMITAKYYWPGQTNEVKEYVSEAGLSLDSRPIKIRILIGLESRLSRTLL